MSAFMNKIFDIFAQEKQQLPHALIIIFIFSYLFPDKSLKIIQIISSKIQLLAPKSFMDLLDKLHLSHADLLTLWAFLLVTFSITVILDFLAQLLLAEKNLVLHSGGQFLLEVNTIFFLSILIYNTLHNPGIKIAFDPNGLYFISVFVSAVLFFIAFCTSYCYIFISFVERVQASDYSPKLKILIYIICLFTFCWLLGKILTLLF